MKTRLLTIATAGLMLASVVWAKEEPAKASRIEVSFVEPDKFTDFKQDYYDSDRGRDHLIQQLTAHLEWLARHYVPEGAKLEVKITDIDLAGDFEPWRDVRYSSIRFLKEVYPPRMKLDFRLIGADGKVISEGHRELSELGYLSHNLLPASDGLRYDKEVLTDWMRSEFRRNK